jgi:nucleotide-binding universal stress UspA family protein
MRHVILPIANDVREANDEIAIAVSLAQALEGRLTVVQSQAASGSTPGAQHASLARGFVDVLGDARVPWSVETAEDNLAAALALSSDHRGIVVMADVPERAIAAALVEHDTAVLAVPRARSPIDWSGEALVLWDGSKPAVHALAFALPLVRRASQVTLFEIDDGSLRHAGSEALGYLREHGVRARELRDLAFGEKAGLLIIDKIAVLHPAYVVMGGFGHARWVERLIGGVTHRLLADSPVPVFLKH